MTEQLTCPHCGNTIEVVNAVDAASILGVSAPSFNLLRDDPFFPEPWIEPKGRRVWLTSDIREYNTARADQRIDDLAERMTDTLMKVGGDNEQEAIGKLAEALMRRVQQAKGAPEQVEAEPVRRRPGRPRKVV